jgi:peptidoglycan/xylan/chitin deacetylase (PgdA/CDA1 family)
MRPKIALLFVARSVGLFALARYLTTSQVRILCYHAGCAGDESSYNPTLFMPGATFRRRMEWLVAQGYEVVTLDQALQHDAGGGKRPRAVITFDDGWYTTASQLLPVLSELGLPSTLYLSTKNFLEGWPIPQVTVRYLLWKTRLRQVEIAGWGAAVDGCYRLDQAREREQLAQRILAAIREGAQEKATVCAALERFAADLDIAPGELDLASRRFGYVTPEELRDLAAQGCSIEAHGHVHRYPKGDAAAFAADLRLCADEIAALGLPRPRHYCYPSGAFDSGAAAVLAEAGMRSATTCVNTLVDPERADAYYLPRFLDGENVAQLDFEAELSGFSPLVRRYLLGPLATLRARLSAADARRGAEQRADAKVAPARPAA